MNILVVTAHTDDLENGMGGTIMRLYEEGHSITSVIMTLPHQFDQKQVRMKESCASHALFDTEPIFIDQPDGKLEVTASLRNRMKEIYTSVAPDVVFTLWPVDVHPDHRAAANLAMGPALERGVNTELFFFEVCSSGRASEAFRPQTLGFFPTHYVDTTDVQEQKKKLMFFQASQDPEGMWTGMRNVHRNRGRECSCAYAEAFVRATRVGESPDEFDGLFVPTEYILPRGIGVDFEPSSIGL